MADEEILEQIEREPLIIETKGTWQPFEAAARQEHEVGQTYKVTINGNCLFAISKENERPTAGIQTNEITYTKDDTNILWIKTGG